MCIRDRPYRHCWHSCSAVNRLIIATAMAASRFSPPATPLLVGERYLPDDVLQRVLVGLPLEAHRAAASVCKSFRRVIAGPRFLAERRRRGFARCRLPTVRGGGRRHRGRDRYTSPMCERHTTRDAIGARSNDRGTAPRRRPRRGLAPTTDTCLLYTSPSPRDATLSRMPSSA